MIPELPSQMTPNDVPKQLDRLRQAVNGLIQDKATSKAATDAQKWKVGDILNELSTLAGTAVRRGQHTPIRSASVLSIHPEYQKKFGELRDRLLSSGGVTHDVMIDYARVAAVLTPEDPLRRTLPSFSYARALSVIKDPEERRYWAEKAKEETYSVGRLRAALNSSRGKEAEMRDLSTEKKASGAGRRGVYICAQTGKKIVDLVEMVELHLDRQHPASPASLPGRNRYAVLRFVNLAAVAQWIAARPQDELTMNLL